MVGARHLQEVRNDADHRVGREKLIAVPVGRSGQSTPTGQEPPEGGTSRHWVKLSMNPTVLSEKTSSLCTKMPSSSRELGFFLDDVEVFDDLRLLVDPLDGVGLKGQLALGGQTAEEHGEAEHDQNRSGCGRQASQPHHEPAEGAFSVVDCPWSVTCTRGCRARPGCPRCCRGRWRRCPRRAVGRSHGSSGSWRSAGRRRRRWRRR